MPYSCAPTKLDELIWRCSWQQVLLIFTWRIAKKAMPPQVRGRRRVYAHLMRYASLNVDGAFNAPIFNYYCVTSFADIVGVA